MSRQRVIALLGKRDAPTDAVEEYCRYLGEALKAHECELVLERVSWEQRGWRAALRSVRRRARSWTDAWILVQYTALAWSARGFPLRLLRVLKILKAAGLRVGVVYHDVEPFAGNRVIDRLRRGAQLRTMREALAASDAAVLTVPAEKLSWIKNHNGKTVFIPVGANLLVSSAAFPKAHVTSGGNLCIAVFGVTGGAAGQEEVERIVNAVRFAALRVKNLRLVVFGRNALEAEAALRSALNDTDVELRVLGVLPDEEVARTLTGSDVLLFVRGPISTRRSSAIAGIACGLPVIAYEGPETAPPITEAGLALFSPQRKVDLGEVLLRVLEDEHYRTSLSQRSWLAQREYFSWHAIGARFAEFLRR
ncbi:MAG TPA: glycosyltransferase [Candidatus Acidoferrum sp.]|nr:glycosyltransferase [Candidatus Acidoferrum sp.]